MRAENENQSKLVRLQGGLTLKDQKLTLLYTRDKRVRGRGRVDVSAFSLT